MTEQIRVEDVVTTIMYGLSELIEEQDDLSQAKAVLYMSLSDIQMYKEETALSVEVDRNEEWVKKYLISMAVGGCTERTVRAYQESYKLFFRLVDKALPDITSQDIRGYLAYCKLARRNKDVTINTKIRILRGLFKWLEEEEYITKNPMLKIKDNKVEQRVKEIFTDEQICILRDSAIRHSPRAIAVVDFLHSTGVRISEMVALNREDVDFSERRCIVYGKGKKERPVYFGGKAAVHLLNYLNGRQDDNEALFVTSRRPYKRLCDCSVRLLLENIADMDERTKGLAVNPHKWRRQFVTDLLERDVPLELVADLAGHRNINTTKENYANYSKNKARDAHRKYLS